MECKPKLHPVFEKVHLPVESAETPPRPLMPSRSSICFPPSPAIITLVSLVVPPFAISSPLLPLTETIAGAIALDWDVDMVKTPIVRWMCRSNSTLKNANGHLSDLTGSSPFPTSGRHHSGPGRVGQHGLPRPFRQLCRTSRSLSLLSSLTPHYPPPPAAATTTSPRRPALRAVRGPGPFGVGKCVR